MTLLVKSIGNPFQEQNRTEQNKTKQNKTKQNKTNKQNKTKQNKTKQEQEQEQEQDRTGQDKTKQNKITSTDYNADAHANYFPYTTHILVPGDQVHKQNLIIIT